jgi:YD repeat-containing protein
MSYSRNNLNQYTSVDGIDYDYDDNGNLTDINDGQYEYVYDCENRLIEAYTPDANVTYEYDYLGIFGEITSLTPTPEPATLLLLGLGSLALLRNRRA